MCGTRLHFRNLNSHIFNQTPKIDLANCEFFQIIIFFYKKQNKHGLTYNRSIEHTKLRGSFNIYKRNKINTFQLPIEHTELRGLFF